jgi:hypothetical protein
MTAVGRVCRPLRVGMRVLGWASVAGLLCLWLTAATTTHDGATSSQVSVTTQVSAPVLLPARQQVDQLAMILPDPVWFPLAGLLLAVAPMVSVGFVARRPVRRQIPRAPPFASAM